MMQIDAPEDDSFVLLKQIQLHYKSSVSVNRLALGRKLPLLVSQIGWSDSVASMGPIISYLATDKESEIREATCEQLPAISTFYKDGGQAGYDLVVSLILPLYLILLGDKIISVQEIAVKSFLLFLPTLYQQDIIDHVLKMIQQLSQDTNRHTRALVGKILNNVSSYIPQEFIVSFTLPLLAILSKDEEASVRSSIGTNLDITCSKLSKVEIIHFIIPFYTQLIKDDNCVVRESCVHNFNHISSHFEKNSAEMLMFGNILKQLIQDGAKTVRASALNSIGKFLTNFYDASLYTQKEKVNTEIQQENEENKESQPMPLTSKTTQEQTNSEHQTLQDELLSNFLKLASTTTEEQDFHHPLNCAFHFPGVLEVVGISRWDEISQFYFYLLRSDNVNIKSTLSYSLHIVSSIIGKERSSLYLMKPFEDFLRDSHESVSTGIIEHFFKFYESVGEKEREKLTEHLQYITSLNITSTKWRKRLLVVNQIVNIISLCPVELLLETTLLPIVQMFIDDDVAIIRNSVIKEIPLVLLYLKEKNFERILNNFVSNFTNINISSYHKKIWYIHLCKYIFINHHNELMDIFEKQLLYAFKSLVNDKVGNVRLALAESVVTMFNHDYQFSSERLEDIRSLLRGDQDSDVRDCLTYSC